MNFKVFLSIILLLFLPGIFNWNLNAQEEILTDLPYWRQALGGEVIGSPVAQVESVVTALDSGNLKSYSSQGVPLWNYYARGRLTPHVSRSLEGTSYICRTNGILIAVSRSGRELWALNLKRPIIFPVLTGWDGRLFIFIEGEITCMTAAGYVLWSKDLEKKIILNPVIDSYGGLIVVFDDGEVQRFDPFGNVFSHLPAFPGPASQNIPSAIASLELDQSGLSILLLFEDGHLELLQPNHDKITYLARSVALPSPPVAAFGRKSEAAVLLKDGRVALVSMENMRIPWLTASHADAGELANYGVLSRSGTADLKLVYDERGVYLVTKTGASGFTSDGRRLWTIRLKGAVSLPSFGDDGILYSGGADWILYAYRLEDRVRSREQLLYGEAPVGNYGLGNPGPSSFAGFYFRFSEAELEKRFSEIREAIKNGNVGANEREYAAWLMETSGVISENFQADNHPPVHALQRVEAARLLGYIGSRETVPFLAGLFRRDPDYTVKAAAAEAIGKIGVDPEGVALRAFQEAIFSPFLRREEVLLSMVAAATGALCRFSGPPLSDAGVRLLTVLSANDMPAIVQRQAQREIRSLTN